MITEIIKGGETIYAFSENEIDEQRLKEIEISSTVKSIEFVFPEGMNLQEASDAILAVEDNKVKTLKVTLND